MFSTEHQGDFAGVWPIFDAAQSQDFWKVNPRLSPSQLDLAITPSKSGQIVQSLTNELEAQGALPWSNYRVSSLATCSGQRFVELLWQLFAHALREVHKQSFPADVAANPLPASLTKVVSQNPHAASLLPVTKARIALERRRLVEGASAAVSRQALWSSLANDLTAEFWVLCAEEAYLQQELERMQDLQDVEDLQDWQARRSGGANVGTGGYTIDEEAMSVDRASALWESILSHAGLCMLLGSVFLVSKEVENINQRSTNDEEDVPTPRSSDDNKLDSSHGMFDGNVTEENQARGEDRFGKLISQLDVAEVIRRWTHALHRLHKQALRLARANDGAGPDLLKDVVGVVQNGHSQAVHATVAEHRQHLANMQALVGQIKDSIPGMEAAVTALRHQVNNSDVVPACLLAQSSLFSPLPYGILPLIKEHNADEVANELTSRGLRPLELVPPSPALKLPQLLSTSPSSLEKTARLQKRFNSFSAVYPLEALQEEDVSRGTSIAGSSIEDGSDAGEKSIMTLRQVE